MPRGDKRGPEGAGPMTGRALGYCAGNNQPGFTVNSAPQGAGRGFRNGAGRGPGFGRGRGRGYGRAAVGRGRFYSESEVDNQNDQNDLNRLENLVNDLAGELNDVKNKIDNLDNN